LVFFDQINFCVGLADFWTLVKICTQNDKFLLQTLHQNFVIFSFGVL